MTARRTRRLLPRLAVATALAVVALGLSTTAPAWATSPSAVTFTATPPTSVASNAPSTWTVGFTTSSGGALGIGSTITITLPAGFSTTSTAPTVTLLTPSTFATDCAGLGQDSSESNVISILIYPAGSGCALAASTAATFSISVVNGFAGAYGASNFSLSTNKDTTAVAPASGETITPTAVSSVSVTGTAPTSPVESAASTWTWGFTTSASGQLGAGDTITLTFPASFTTVSTIPTVNLVSPSAFPTDCTATSSDANEGSVVVITLSNNGSNTCALADSTAATINVAVVNGTSDALSSFSLATDEDATATSPTGTAPTLTSPTSSSGVTFTTTAPTSLTANAASTWTVGFTTSSSGALAGGGYLVAQFPSGFTTSSTTPPVTLVMPSGFASNCTAVGSDPTKGTVVVVTLANKGASVCTLAGSTGATLSIGVVNGPTGTYGDTTYALRTSKDGTFVEPTSGSETLTAAVPATGTPWTAALASSGGEAHGLAAPSVPTTPTGGASSGFMCASASSEKVELTWTAVANATSYVIEQATTANGTYAVASPAPVFSGASATITYTTAVTEYYEIKAMIGTNWASALSTVAVNGGVTSGFVVTSTSAPECTDS
jgi:hypothetical protein